MYKALGKSNVVVSLLKQSSSNYAGTELFRNYVSENILNSKTYSYIRLTHIATTTTTSIIMSVEDPSTWPQYATIDPEFKAVRTLALNTNPHNSNPCRDIYIHKKPRNRTNHTTRL